MTGEQPAGQATEAPVDLLLQHRHELETERVRLLDRVAKVRSGALSLAIILVLAQFLLERFLYVATTERWTMALLPLIVLVATGLLDLLHYQPQLAQKDARVATLEARLRTVDEHELIPEEPDRRKAMGDPLVLAYYLVPILALLGLVLWRLL